MKKARYRLFSMGIILLMFILAACGGETEKQEAPSLAEPVGVNLDTAKVLRGDLSSLQTYLGAMRASLTELYFDADGTVDEIYVAQGQYVEEGDLLIGLDQTGNLARIEQLEKSVQEKTQNGVYEDQIADLNMQILQLDLQGIQEREGSGSQAYKMKSLEIEAAALEKSQKTELRDQEIAELNGEIETLRKKTEAQTLSAPHAGRVYYDDSIKNGTFVRALKTVMTISDPEELKFVVPEAVDNRIVENGSARAWILGKEWELEYVPLTGDERLSYIKRNQIPPTFFNVKTPDKDHELYAGLSGALLGETWKLEDVLYVPVNALLKDGGQNYVYVIRDGTRTRKDVKTGYTNGVNTIITEGLEEGEIIYVKE